MFFLLYIFLMVIPLTAALLPSCRVKIINPRPGSRFRPGDEIDVKWDLIGVECRNPMDVKAILFANLTRKDEWKWDYRLNLYQESNTDITSFTYPIQLILSPNVRNSSLFFLDIELTFATNPPGSIFDVMGPFTILPIPSNIDDGQDNSNQQHVTINSADILTTEIGWIYVIYVMVVIYLLHEIGN